MVSYQSYHGNACRCVKNGLVKLSNSCPVNEAYNFVDMIFLFRCISNVCCKLIQPPTLESGFVPPCFVVSSPLISLFLSPMYVYGRCRLPARTVDTCRSLCERTPAILPVSGGSVTTVYTTYLPAGRRHSGLTQLLTHKRVYW